MMSSGMEADEIFYSQMEPDINLSDLEHVLQINQLMSSKKTQDYSGMHTDCKTNNLSTPHNESSKISFAKKMSNVQANLRLDNFS